MSHYTEAGPRPAGTVLTVDFVLDGQEYRMKKIDIAALYAAADNA